MEASDELQAFLTKATQDGVWGRLLDRGAAWSIMRQAGVLPEDAPPLGEQIDIDLAEHGFSTLRAALSLRELDGTSALCQRAFERAGNAFQGFIVSTSANPAGLPPARSLQDANHYFAQQVDYLNGDLGLSQEPSRILDAETGAVVRA